MSSALYLSIKTYIYFVISGWPFLTLDLSPPLPPSLPPSLSIYIYICCHLREQICELDEHEHALSLRNPMDEFGDGREFRSKGTASLQDKWIKG